MSHPKTLLKLLWILAPVLCLAVAIVRTLHWPLVNDTAIIHYACFLTGHGWVPYRDIQDVNLPGAYLVDCTAMHIFGAGAMGWRLYDLCVLLSITAGMAVLARLAVQCAAGGLWGGLLFSLYHLHDGMAQGGQRDLSMTALLLWAAVCVAYPAGRYPVWRLIGGGAMAATACMIKPTAALFLVVFLYLLLRDRTASRSKTAGNVAWFVLGMVLPVAWVGFRLYVQGAIPALIKTVTVLLPYHASLGRLGWSALIARSTSSSIRALVIFSLAAAYLRGRCRSGDRPILVMLVLAGFASYLLQGKGFPDHRYPFLAFLFLWIGTELMSALSGSRRARVVAMIGFAFGSLAAAPLYARAAMRAHWNGSLESALTADLRHLSGSQLAGNVQCIDSISGCTTVLNRLRLVQSTGVLYDEFLFGPHMPLEVSQLRDGFGARLAAMPPRVIVVTKGLFPEGPDGYAKLERWPWFADFLKAQYSLQTERDFGTGSTGPLGYRIYLHH